VRFHLRVSTRFFASPEEVWALKTDPDRLRDEFRPWLHLSVDDPTALADALQGVGLPRTVQARIGMVLPWPIEVTACERGQHFTDLSPGNVIFDHWVHRHEVQVASDAVRYMDAVTFSSQWGPPHLVARMVERLFVHRHRRAARNMQTDEKATAVSMLRELLDVQSDGTEGFL
jgi:ligand-binding SRPBCC domain-containing protein